MKMQKCFNCLNDFDIDIDTICPFCGYYQNEQFENENKKNALVPGTILKNQYYIGKVLGIGGFAITYIAHDNARNCKVAIKEFFPSGIALRSENGNDVFPQPGDAELQFERGLEKFFEESSQLAKVGTHQGIVNVFETFHINGTAYIVMEFVNGESLESYLSENSTMDYKELFAILVPICESLDHIHTNERIVHKDIAPDNIMLQPNGKGKLIDFGASGVSGNINRDFILKHGYAPVEQYDVEDTCTPLTDVYAMSATVYHMLTGKKPLRSDKRKEAIEKGEKDPLLPISDYNVVLPPELEQVILKGLSINPEDRVSSMHELASVFSNYIEKDTVVISQTPPPPKKPPVALIVCIAAALAVVLGVLAIFIFGGNKKVKTGNVICTVPELINKDIYSAAEYLGNFDTVTFTIEEAKTTVKTDDISLDGLIAKQEPREGSDVYESEASSEIKVAVYLYEYDDDKPEDEKVSVPSVVKLSAKSAEKSLKDKGFTNIKYTYTFSDTVEKDIVIAQSVTAGSKRTVDTQVILTVSKGSEPTTVQVLQEEEPEVPEKPAFDEPDVVIDDEEDDEDVQFEENDDFVDEGDDVFSFE